MTYRVPYLPTIPTFLVRLAIVERFLLNEREKENRFDLEQNRITKVERCFLLDMNLFDRNVSNERLFNTYQIYYDMTMELS
jgi:hypothetical protein